MKTFGFIYNVMYIVFVESKQGTNASEIHKKLAVALSYKAPSLPTVYRWMESKIGGRDRHRAGRPVTVVNEQNAEQVKKILAEDARTTLFELSTVTQLFISPVSRILHDVLKCRKVCAKWVPHLLTYDQKEHRVLVAKAMLSMFASDDQNASQIL